MSAAHTPTPWRLETVRTSCGICHKVGPFPGKVGKAGITHACIYDDYPPNTHSVELEANARFIVHAVNCHDELLEALEGLASAVNTRSLRGRDHIPSMREEQGAMAFARAAIAKALGRTPNEIGDEG